LAISKTVGNITVIMRPPKFYDELWFYINSKCKLKTARVSLLKVSSFVIVVAEPESIEENETMRRIPSIKLSGLEDLKEGEYQASLQISLESGESCGMLIKAIKIGEIETDEN